MQAVAPIPENIQAPLLGRLMGALDASQRWIMIDLGVGTPSMIQALNGHRVRLDAMDMANKLTRWRQAETRKQKRAWIEQDLAPFALEPADYIFCWSSLNYLDSDCLKLFSEVLQPYLKPRALVHALIEYASPTMPAQAPTCQISQAGHHWSIDLAPVATSVPSPRYTPKHLENSLMGLSIQSTVVLSNGMQEFLFSKAP